jgi:hypothetical protein
VAAIEPNNGDAPIDCHWVLHWAHAGAPQVVANAAAASQGRAGKRALECVVMAEMRNLHATATEAGAADGGHWIGY